MSVQPPDGPLAAARRLERQAMETGEESPGGRALRAQAAALRRELIGERSYPVLVCADCFDLTGWTTAAGLCVVCARSRCARRAEAAASGWLPAAEPPPVPAAAHSRRPGVAVRLAAQLGRRDALEHAEVLEWLRRVEPDDTGPIVPERGFSIECATRRELERVGEPGLLVCFATASERFGAGGWERSSITTIPRFLLPNPTAFAADLPVSVLVDAWSDYKQALTAINRGRWRELRERREAQRLAAETREDALLAERHTAELLDE